MTRLILKAETFDLAHSAVATSRSLVASSLEAAFDEDEHSFWKKRLAAYDALLAQFEAAKAADTSQDADPDEDEPEED